MNCLQKSLVVYTEDSGSGPVFSSFVATSSMVKSLKQESWEGGGKLAP